MHRVVPDLRLRVLSPNDDTIPNLTGHDVVFAPGVFDDTTYEALTKEISTLNDGSMFLPWHKDAHSIANDKYMHGAWKTQSPTFCSIVDRVCALFNVRPMATRLNLYQGAGVFNIPDTKPFHHDRAAFTPGLTQNITIGVSFGATRELAFRHVNKRNRNNKGAVLSLVCPHGSVYAFARDVNIEFQHGVLAPLDSAPVGDRVSIIVWGETRAPLLLHDSRISQSQVPSKYDLGINGTRKRRSSKQQK